MIKDYYNEKWSNFDLGFASKRNYAVSDYGRIVSYLDEIKQGRLLEGCRQQGYKIMRYAIFDGKKANKRHLFFHRLVAEHFLADKAEDQIYVIHLDFDKENNRAENLKWVSKDELVAHQQKNPAVIQAISNMVKDIHAGKRNKLNPSKVLFIRAKLDDPNRKTRMRMLAKQFDVSEMQLYRIKRRENWGHVPTPPKPPVSDK